MRTLISTLRNMAFVVLLWTASTVAVPTDVSAGSCTTAYFANWSGSCAGPFDACGYFRQECEYYCFVHYAGSLCSADLLWCTQYNAGTEESPNYCLSNGWCKCDVF
jgi:hypothetical protein